MKITDILNTKEKTLSIEFFPPKTPAGHEKLLHTIAELSKCKPDFMTCTYGAGGGSRDKTLDIVKHIQDTHMIPSMHHLTCVMHTKDEILKIVTDIKNAGIRNILALRGDPPKDNPDWTPGPENFKFSCELVAFIREHFGDYFAIAVAGFPEGHALAKDRDTDVNYLTSKMEAGADWIITQLFFDNKDYFEYVKRVRKAGIEARIIPGILPITDYKGLLRFCDMCGATVTDQVKSVFEPIQDDPEKVLSVGIEFAIRQCQALLKGGAPGIHLYCLNKIHPADQIIKELKFQ